MPWTAESFAEKHNKKLKGRAAEKAADMANAMIKSGTDEGTAIATANKHGNKLMRSHALYDNPRSRKGYAQGGEVKETAQQQQDEQIAAAIRASRARDKSSSPASDGKFDADDNDNFRGPFQGGVPKGHLEEEVRPAFYGKGETGVARGGKITKTVGPKPPNADDGWITAQKGEFVVKKAAVKKLGTATLNEINKGRLAKAKVMYDHKKS